MKTNQKDSDETNPLLTQSKANKNLARQQSFSACLETVKSKQTAQVNDQQATDNARVLPR